MEKRVRKLEWRSEAGVSEENIEIATTAASSGHDDQLLTQATGIREEARVIGDPLHVLVGQHSEPEVPGHNTLLNTGPDNLMVRSARDVESGRWSGIDVNVVNKAGA